MPAGSISAPTIIPLKAPQGPKHIIDSSTRIEITSDTLDTLVFYSLDSSRPQPSRRNERRSRAVASNITFPYRAPFTLSRAGKATIKALACSMDLSRESSVVTRTFTVVEAMAQDSDAESESEVVQEDNPSHPRSISAQLRQRLDMTSLTSIFSVKGTTADSDVSSLKPPTNIQRSKSAPFNGSSHSLGRVNAKSIGQANIKSRGRVAIKTIGHASVHGTAISAGTIISRPVTVAIPKPTCLFCKSLRSKDIGHKFCTQCGCQLPPLPDMEPSAPLQVLVCSHCHAHVPLGSSSCLVCEHSLLHPTPIPVIQAQACSNQDITCKKEVVCLMCGTRNPDNVRLCLTCEKPLSPQPPPLHPPPSSFPPSPVPTSTVLRPVSGSSYMMCGQCGRVNVSDARFCDWCGSKPSGSQLSVQCVCCKTANQWHYTHCYACGNFIKAPLRPNVELSSTMKIPAHVDLDKNAWIPVLDIADKGPEVKSCAIQTDGIFYPSSRTIDNQKGSDSMKKMISLTGGDRLPKLQSCSPGKGLWRMQVEHMCTHLKAYTQRSNTFQSGIGTLLLGKLLSAEVKEDIENTDILLTYESKTQLHPKSMHAKSLQKTSSCSSISASSSASQISHTRGSAAAKPPASTSSLAQSRPHRHKRKGSRRTDSLKDSLTTATKNLIGELSLSGRNRKDVVTTLIQDGADVNVCVPEVGLPLLSLVASNGHMDSIALLVESGAKLDAQSSSTGNTALHEAVLKGTSSVPCIEILLGLGANPKQRNASGLTPCDLALKLKFDMIVTCFATYVGAGLLEDLYRHQSGLSLTL